jgi:transmembrane sensor
MDIKLLERFYRNECTAEEVKKVLSWFEQEEPQKAQEEALNEIWRQAELDKNEPVYAHDAEKPLANILSQKGPEHAQDAGKDSPIRRLGPATPWQHYLKIAAALLLPVLFVWVLTQKYETKKAPQLITIQAQPGLKKTITLADGSVIKLHSGSSISYQSDFKSNRTITLNGEAFFQVAKDSLHPFTVRSGTIHTQALGTSFNINYQKRDSTISVALATGRVKVSQEMKKASVQLAVLEPGQQLVYSKTSAAYQVGPFDAGKVLGWKDGVLHFEGASLATVIHELERWYGVQVAVRGDSAKQEWHYTGAYNSQSLETVLQGMSYVKKFTYTRPDSSTVLLTLGD